jgi:hypothetical protein
MKRVAATLVAVALVLAGCGTLFPEPVHLLTADAADFTGVSLMIGGFPDRCGYPWEGRLVADATSGTALITGNRGAVVPVVWRPGFTGRRSGSEVQVVDPQGNVVAVTGHKYSLDGGSMDNGDIMAADFVWPGLPVPRAIYSCGRVTELP